MPNEVSFELHNLELVIVHFGNDLRRPLLIEKSEFFFEIDGFDWHKGILFYSWQAFLLLGGWTVGLTPRALEGKNFSDDFLLFLIDAQDDFFFELLGETEFIGQAFYVIGGMREPSRDLQDAIIEVRLLNRKGEEGIFRRLVFLPTEKLRAGHPHR